MPRHRFRVVLSRLLLPLLLPTVCLPILSGCTVARLEHETGQVLDWARLRTHTELPLSGRWQLPRDSRILVRERAPAPNAHWLAAAQAGVDAVFPPGVPGAGNVILMVSWPDAQPDRRFWPDAQAPLPLQVALYRERDGALVESAEVTAMPHWWFDQDDSPALVQRAFRDLAETYRGRH